MSNPMTNSGQISPRFQRISERSNTLPSSLTEKPPSSRKPTFGRAITLENTATKTIPPTQSHLSRILLHQRRTGSTDSTGSNHPNYAEYRAMYEELTEKYRSPPPLCGIGGMRSSSQSSQQERSPLELFSPSTIRSHSISSFKAYLIDRVEPYFKELRDRPITFTGDIQRLNCFIKITLLIYCQYKKRCFDSGNMLQTKFEGNFEEIDYFHLLLYGKILSHLASRGGKITDIIKEETLSTTELTEGRSNIHPVFLEKTSAKFSEFRATYRTLYPPFIVDLICRRKSEEQIFESVETQLSIESTGSSQHSGIVVFETSDPAPSGS